MTRSKRRRCAGLRLEPDRRNDDFIFLGGGRRPYLTGLIQNVNSNADAQPWIGCYWTSGLGTDELSASGLYFSLDTDDAASSEFVPARNYQRANGLQVRCVRE